MAYGERMTAKKKRAAKPRLRRTPEEARAQILEAAQRLLAERGPDAEGLKDVATEAGVSHALVSHYFGTYDALVQEALRAHLLAMRAQMIGRIASADELEEWIDLAFEQVSRPLSGRLLVWALLGDRLDSVDFFARRERGMKQTVDA